MINNPPPLKGLSIGIPILILIEGGGLLITSLHSSLQPLNEKFPKTYHIVSVSPITMLSGFIFWRVLSLPFGGLRKRTYEP